MPAHGQLHQFTAFKIGEQAVLVSGVPGTGKTSLALAFIDRGATLIGDDGVCLTPTGGDLIASPPNETSGLIELRNVGLISMPVASAPVALHLSLSANAPRFIERAFTIEIDGCPIPSLDFTLNGLTDCIRVEHALNLYGRKA
ncbi:MAG: serine kinase [Pontixanthobacter sp.]